MLNNAVIYSSWIVKQFKERIQQFIMVFSFLKKLSTSLGKAVKVHSFQFELASSETLLPIKSKRLFFKDFLASATDKGL